MGIFCSFDYENISGPELFNRIRKLYSMFVVYSVSRIIHIRLKFLTNIQMILRGLFSCIVYDSVKAIIRVVQHGNVITLSHSFSYTPKQKRVYAKSGKL